jgi:hypothetical protein
MLYYNQRKFNVKPDDCSSTVFQNSLCSKTVFQNWYTLSARNV